KENSANGIKNVIQDSKIDTTESNYKITETDILDEKYSKVNLDTLIPIEILNKDSKDVYKKYGLEFTGNCYACDLAEFRIENKEIIISNVCDLNEYLKYDILNLKNSEKRIEIKTKKYKFIFTRVENEPIFKLQIINYDIKNKKLRISEYYTFKESLLKFETHDCGDFDG
ncbi:hypothetical protein, partial [Flavobacterium gelidilacus]|uniref:hypothetical protein n=1 Tax=Flavobacterium gelidilacus TaxID=206041 RepID=UPI0039F08F9F